jgi:hypothetical protein
LSQLASISDSTGAHLLRESSTMQRKGAERQHANEHNCEKHGDQRR